MTAPLRSDPTIVKVALDARSYDIVVGRGLIGSLGARIAALRPGAKTAVVTDEDVARYHLGAAEASLAAAGLAASRVIVPVGEGSKSFHTFQRVCEALVAELVKYGLLGDAAFFSWLEADWRDVFAAGGSSGSHAREHAIAVSCRAKAAIVAR